VDEPVTGVDSNTFAPGDIVQLTEPKGRHHTIILEPGKRFHTHKGFLIHDQLIGQPNGSIVTTDKDVDYLALRPRLADFVLSMPRGAAIIYPQDAAEIVYRADIAPGHRVVEAGVGSGALTLWLLRALAPDGQLTSVERRAEFAEVATGNVSTFYPAGTPASWTLEVGDFVDRAAAMPAHSVDRVILDMLAPWECLDEAWRILGPGGILLTYVATVTQLSRVAEALKNHGGFTPAEATESLVRGWHLDGLAVRPDHRMIGHTGFLAWARTLADGHRMPRSLTKKVKPDYHPDDVELWTPGALGLRQETDKKMRDLGKEATKRSRSVSGDSSVS
jgi:tRNA (adenine57-N1/adenine58-N1)-methyltransferase catalytic subunit